MKTPLGILFILEWNSHRKTPFYNGEGYLAPSITTKTQWNR